MKRAGGVLMHVSSLPGAYSSGSFGKSAEKFIDFLADCGFSYWQVLPFCVTDACHSPYKSPSAFSGNPYFIDLEKLYADGLLTRAELLAAKQESPYLCEFERLEKERVPLLLRAAARVKDRAPIKAFLADHPHVAFFCKYMAKGDSEIEDGWAFIQYTFMQQWNEVRSYAAARGVKIIGDVPIYVDNDSADVAEDPTLFDLDKDGRPNGVAGVPPDYFSEDGQMWGNPLYNWKRMKTDGYAWWCDRMKHMFLLFDGVRIDHFRGFDTYFSIPAGDPNARRGVWKKGPGKPFIDKIKEVADGRLIIAEDLGEHSPSVEALLKYSGFPGTRVLQFAFPAEENNRHIPHNYNENCVAYTGTHDNNTLLGYLWEVTPDVRETLFRYCGYDGGDKDVGCRVLLRSMLASHAGLVILPIQDLLVFGKDTRLNTPGVSTGNWAYRVTEEQLASIDRDTLRAWNKLYERN